MTTRKKRLTQAEALEQVRAQIRVEKVSPKPRWVRERSDGPDGPGHSTHDGSGQRDREQWITLPKHLSMYVGEQGVISQGYVWTHRVDRRAARTDANGVKRTPVRLVNLGPVDARNPNYQRENNGPGQQTVKGAKTPGFVLDSKASRSDTC
jgi:hypothetical protein